MDRRRTPNGRGDQHERGARAGAGRPPAEADLAGFTGDERTLVAMLGGLADVTAPDGGERSRIRSRVLAGLADDRTAQQPAAPTPVTKPRMLRPPGTRSPRASRPPRGPRSEDDRPRGTSARGRFAIAAVAVLCLVFALGGMSLLLSRDALPGDALYGIKRTAEAASLGLTFGDQQQAFKHLEFATSRVTEMETLAQRYGPGDAPVGGYLSALTDFDTDASAGSRQLIALTTRQDGSLLSTLSAWARQQQDRLTAITPRLPGAARTSESSSLSLSDAIADRADALAARLPCSQITSGNADDLGALPATGPCDRVGGSGGSGTSGTAPGRQQSSSGAAVTTTPAAPTDGQPRPGQPSRPTRSSQPGLPGAPIVVPTTSGGQQPGGTGGQTTTSTPPPIVLPLPLPPITLGPLLPGLPGLQLGS